MAWTFANADAICVRSLVNSVNHMRFSSSPMSITIIATSSPEGSLANWFSIDLITAGLFRNLPAPSSRRSKIRMSASGFRAWPSRVKYERFRGFPSSRLKVILREIRNWESCFLVFHKGVKKNDARLDTNRVVDFLGRCADAQQSHRYDRQKNVQTKTQRRKTKTQRSELAGPEVGRAVRVSKHRRSLCLSYLRPCLLV
jgi:hypothetical protein